MKEKLCEILKQNSLLLVKSQVLNKITLGTHNGNKRCIKMYQNPYFQFKSTNCYSEFNLRVKLLKPLFHA